MAPKPFDDPVQIVRALSQQATICSDQVAHSIAEVGTLATFNEGEPIARQGEMGSTLFYILSGSVKVLVNEHEYKVRGRGQMIGEMAAIEPGERRSADLVANTNNTVLWVVEASDFLAKAAEHGELWECIARELASRLRQRDEQFMPPNAKPTIFIASSGEGKAILEKTAAFLKRSEWDVRPWNETGIFTPTLGTLEELERQAHEVDFAVIIVTPDDICESRDKVSFSPRDNVMIELGLFVGSLERKRAFLLTSVDPDLKLASDLHGATILYFNDDAQLDARLGEIEKAIQRIGRVYRLCKVVG